MTLRQHTTQISNVLVIGSGGAGLRAAIEAKVAGLSVSVIGKRNRGDVHTVLAAGGINAAMGNVDPEDSWQQHFADTYVEGYGIAEPRIIELMAKEAPGLVEEIDAWGANFARLEDGRIDQRYFGAHTYRRTCYSGDYTGRSILLALLCEASAYDIPIHDSQYVTELLVEDGTFFGAMSFNLKSGERTVHLADAVVLAAGGHTRIWRKSSSRKNENTGDGFYLGLKAGCQLTDMEMVQFHPTGMVIPEDIAGTLVTEAVRGEGGRLINGNGERFMDKYDSKRMELSTRDRVAMANYTEILEGRATKNGGVYLDISHRDKDFIIEKLPRMYRLFLDALMIDISKEPMEVAPTAHYSMGGLVVTPEEHWTGVEGLYAAGEVTGGLHGANRLGGNSLAEILIFGKRAGRAAAAHSEQLSVHLRSKSAIAAAHDKIDGFIKKGSELARPLQRSLRNIMWEHCGVVRDQEKLKTGLDKLNDLRKAVQDVDVRIDSEGCEDLALVFDLEASILSAEATILSALERRESRGSHQRSDFMDVHDSERVNYRINAEKDLSLKISTHAIEPLSTELQAIVDGTHEIANFEGKLVE
ncbi:MAG: FAD-binding protein [Cyanobacteria bacterium P01_F01_bin.42]